MNNKIITISFREIKKSFKRFLSLFIMSFLGVAVFVGIKSCAKIMLVSLDKYYDDNRVYDLKIISTLGLTDEDVDELVKLDSISEAYGVHSKDVYFTNNETEYVIRINAINDDINKIVLKDGRLPSNDNEILVEEYLLVTNELEIGDTILIDDPDNNVKTKEFKIVGVAVSPIYMLVGSPALTRGTTNIGTGLINFYSYALDTVFDMDYYSEIYLKVNGAEELYTSEKDYIDLINKALEEVKSIKEDREQARYDQIYNQVMDEIKKNEDKANSELSSISSKLEAAKKELDNGLNTLNANKSKIENAKKELNKSLATLNSAKRQINDGEVKLNSAKKELEKAKKELNDKLNSYNLTYDDILTMMDLFNGKEVTRERFKSLVDKNSPYKEDIYKAIDYLYDHDFINTINKYFETGLEKFKNEIINAIPKDYENYDKIVEFINGINVSKVRSIIFKEILNTDNVATLKNHIPKWVKNYDKIINYIDKYANSVNNIKSLFDGVNKISAGEKEIASKEKELKKAKSDYEAGYKKYLEYKKQIEDSERQLNNGYNTYYKNLSLYNSNLNSFNDNRLEIQKKLNDAKNDISSLEVPTWYIDTRMDNSDYFNFINVGDSITKLSRAFPTIFFIVAVFMSVMCMSRMALEDRSEIGSLKALGFSKYHIMTKYFIYAALATLIGGILGSLFGFFFLTYFIWKMYRILFTMLEFKYYFDIVPFIVGILVSFVCITGASLLTVRGMVNEKTAELLRPKAPVLGKKMFLERLPFWNRIKFSNKVTIRNVFRYKKRVIMTIIGIIGCTVLLITGYGIRDSIINIPKKQYSEIMTFDDMVYLDGEEFDLDEVFDSEHIKSRLYLDLLQVEIGVNSANLNAFEDESMIANVIKLKSNITGEKIELQDDKIVITEKLAELSNKKIGDTISFVDSENNTYELVISDISVNYIGNHMYVNKATYEKYIGKYVNNVAYLNYDDMENEEEVINKAMESGHVRLILNTENTKSTVSSMLKSLDSIVYLLIIFSGLLSFVVLYNLSYINISERKREIASLKVLGFYNGEVDNYIIKENIIITIVGIIIGIFLGKPFVDYIVNSIEVDLVRFIHTIDLISYIKTGLFMLLFTAIVSVIIHFALKKINMIESLKSVE